MKQIGRLSVVAGIIAAAFLLVVTSSWGAGGTVTNPTGTAPDRYVYYPGTEPLDEGEIRIIACGTDKGIENPFYTN